MWPRFRAFRRLTARQEREPIVLASGRRTELRNHQRELQGFQMRLAVSAERGAKLRKVLHYNGLPIDARSITDEILAQEGIPRPAHAGASEALLAGKD